MPDTFYSGLCKYMLFSDNEYCHEIRYNKYKHGTLKDTCTIFVKHVGDASLIIEDWNKLSTVANSGWTYSILSR